MNPKYIIIVIKRSSKDPITSRIVSATIAYNPEEAENIASKLVDSYHDIITLECDYTIRGE